MFRVPFTVTVLPLMLLTAGRPLSAEDRKTPQRRDLGKYAIESPLKRLVAKRATPREPKEAQKPPASKPAVQRGNSGGFKNPKVQPGNVDWHPDFEKAVKAAAKSRRPVLLFQMIGNLDERFS